jgi:hypothetical protein
MPSLAAVVVTPLRMLCCCDLAPFRLIVCNIVNTRSQPAAYLCDCLSVHVNPLPLLLLLLLLLLLVFHCSARTTILTTAQSANAN